MTQLTPIVPIVYSRGGGGGGGCIVDCKQTVFYIKEDEAGGEQTERARPQLWTSRHTCSVSSSTAQHSQAGHLARSIPITIEPAQTPPLAPAPEGKEKENDSIKAAGAAGFSPKIRTIPIEILDCEGEEKVEVMSTAPARTIPIQRINSMSPPHPHLSRTPSGESESFPSQKIKMGTSAIKIPIQVS